ncbi:BLOC-2 complex member HPS6 [Engraulis encrasicolus]|uniref:BLOC-2 complex member HPS6 n=1 Tax=Engraulis encrasicolus TaxID=184585 RepID=UPI002FD7152D
MTRLALDQVTDFGDFTRGKDLNEFLKQTFTNNSSRNGLSDIRVSPDGRHIHVILRKPKSGLMTFDKFQRPHLIQCQKYLDLSLTKTSPVVDVVYLDNNKESGVAVLTVVFENGKAEFWKFWERKSGWHLIQTVDLCNSPRARVVSVCVSLNFIAWCEERPPSENSSVLGPNRNNFRYCICKRTFEVDEGGVSLGGVKIALHNNPRYTVTSSGENVYLFAADNKDNQSPGTVSKFFLTWSPQNDVFRVSSTCGGALLQRSSVPHRESDFKGLVTDCIGALSNISPPSVCGHASARNSGGLLMLLSSGWVCEMQKDGVLRHIYKLPDNCQASTWTHTSLSVYHDVLALTVGKTLYLIDTKCGRELEKISLKVESLLFVNSLESHTPHLLSDSGLFVVMRRDTAADLKNKPSPSSSSSSPSTLVSADAVLVEAVFEEACKYYQQRSLGSTQLTAEKLKKGGMFQAPLSLASILRDYLSGQKPADIAKGISGGGSGGNDKLLCSLEEELKSLVGLEDTKLTLVRASEKDLEDLGESLVQQEVGRLLGSEVDRDSLIQLNFIFQTFPDEAWRALQSALQLRCNGEGSLCSKAPAEVWKSILAPIPSVTSFHQQPHHAHHHHHHHHAHHHHNGQQSKQQAAAPPPVNVALPVFELLCHSVFRFQPGWLPRFLELAQDQAGSSSAGSSTWSYGVVKETPDDSLPLYRRALSILPDAGGGHQYQDLEVELLLCSRRPNAVMQALRILMGTGQWERATRVAERFCRQSPLLNKEIFTTLLCEVAHHRHLDPYLELLWALCPEDITVTSILNIVLKNLPPTPVPTPSPCPSSGAVGCIGGGVFGSGGVSAGGFGSGSGISGGVWGIGHSSHGSGSPPAGPFPIHSSQLTIGLLKPLLNKVLLRETKPSQRYADILQSPTFPPPTPPRQAKGLPRPATEPISLLDAQNPAAAQMNQNQQQQLEKSGYTRTSSPSSRPPSFINPV